MNADSPTSIRLDPRRLVIGAAMGLAICLTGCQSIREGLTPASTPPGPPNPPQIGATGLRTDESPFRSEASIDQEFGLHMTMARAYQREGRPDAAVLALEKAIDIAESAPTGRGEQRLSREEKGEAYRRLAAAYDELGQFDKAEENYEVAIDLTPRDARAWNDYGYSLYLQRRWDESVETLRKASQLAPDDARVRTNLGLSLAASNQVDEALEVLTPLQGPAAAHANVGYVLAAIGRGDLASQHYRKARELQPNLVASTRALDRLRATPTGSRAPTSRIAADTRSAPRDPAVSTASMSR